MLLCNKYYMAVGRFMNVVMDNMDILCVETG